MKESLARAFRSPWVKAGFAVLVLVLLIVFHGIDLRTLYAATKAWPWLLAAFLVMLPSYAIVSYRFTFALRAFDLPASPRDAVRWTMIGSFFDVAMPGSSGGDLVKIGYLVGHFGKGYRIRSVMAIVVDRVLGLFGLLIIAALSCVLGWKSISRLHNVKYLVLLVSILCAGSLLLFVFLTWPGLAKSGRFQRLLGSLPFGGMIERAHLSLAALRKKKRSLFTILLLSLANHMFWCSSLFLITRSVGLSVPLAQGLVVFPLAIFLNTFGFAGGFGVGTLAFDFLFTFLLATNNGIAVGLIFQGLSFISRLTGLPFFLISRDAKNIPDSKTPIEIASKEKFL